MSAVTAERVSARLGRVSARGPLSAGGGDQLTELLDAVARTAGAARGRVLHGFVTVNEELAAVEVARGPLRLTRRGRTVAAALIVLLLGASLLAGLVAASASTAPARQGASAAASGPQWSGGAGAPERAVVRAQAEVVVVRSGDTLWSIAARHFPDRDPREAVVALREANGIDGGVLTAGQRLRLPAGG